MKIPVQSCLEIIKAMKKWGKFCCNIFFICKIKGNSKIIAVTRNLVGFSPFSFYKKLITLMVKRHSFKISINVFEILVNHLEFQEEMKNQLYLDMILKNFKLSLPKVVARVMSEFYLWWFFLYSRLDCFDFIFTSYLTKAFVLFEHHNIC